MAKIVIDKDACIGCGTCAAVCEIAFGMKDGKAFVKPGAEKKDCTKKAVDACPVQCIKMK